MPERRYTNGLYELSQRLKNWDEKIDNAISTGTDNLFEGIDRRTRERQQRRLERQSNRIRGQVPCDVILVNDTILMEEGYDPRGENFPNMRLPSRLYGTLSNSGLRLVNHEGIQRVVADIVIFLDNSPVEDADILGEPLGRTYFHKNYLVGENAIPIVNGTIDTLSNDKIRYGTRFKLRVASGELDLDRVLDNPELLELVIENTIQPIPPQLRELVPRNSDNIDPEVREFCAVTGLDESEIQHEIDLNAAEIQVHEGRDGIYTYTYLGEQGWFVFRGDSVVSITPEGPLLSGRTTMENNPAVPNIFDTSPPNNLERMGVPQTIFAPYLRYLPDIAKVVRWVDIGVHIIKGMKAGIDYLNGIRTDDEVNRLLQSYEEALQQSRLEREAEGDVETDKEGSFIKFTATQEGYRGTYANAWDSRNDFEREVLDEKSKEVRKYLKNRQERKRNGEEDYGVWIEADVGDSGTRAIVSDSRGWIDRWRDSNAEFTTARERDAAEREREEAEQTWPKPPKDEEPYINYTGEEDAF